MSDRPVGAYIRFSHAAVARTEEMVPGAAYVDYDADDNVIGFDFCDGIADKIES